jgi:hypothetical protein
MSSRDRGRSGGEVPAATAGVSNDVTDLLARIILPLILIA